MLSSNLLFMISLAVTAIPLLFGSAAIILLIPHLFGMQVSEKFSYGVVRIALFLGFIMGLVLVPALAFVEAGSIFIEEGTWFGYGDAQFKFLFQLDVPAVAYGVSVSPWWR